MINKKYLPSEKFIIRIVIIIIGITLVLGIYELSRFLINKIKKEGRQSIKSLLISDQIEKDSNNNGIPDWEESLWGLDPKKNGRENREIILDKKSALSPSQKNISVSDNEMLAREFFAVISSLTEEGNIDNITLEEINNSVSKTIEPPILPDIFTRDMVNTVEDSNLSREKYIDELRKLTIKYEENEDVGKELIFISQGILNQNKQAMYVARLVANSYKLIARDILLIPTPDIMANISLKIANIYYKMGQSIEGMSETIEDPIAGMQSLLNYKKYNEMLFKTIKELSVFR